MRFKNMIAEHGSRSWSGLWKRRSGLQRLALDGNERTSVYIWRTDLAASGSSFLTAEFSALAWCTSADASSDVVSCLLMRNCMQREHEQLGRRYGDSGQEERVLMHDASTKELPDSG
jgi:hypothetical protein